MAEQDSIPHETESIAPILLKSIGIVVLFLLSIVMGILPLKLKAFQSNMRLTGLVNALSAGIFLSVGLLHLLPEAHEMIQKNLNNKFPLSFLIAILSYTFILIIEKLAFDTHKWLEVHVHPDVHHHEHKRSFKQDKQEASTFLVSVKGKYGCCPEDEEKLKKKEENEKNECNEIMESCSHDDFLFSKKENRMRGFSKDSAIIERKEEILLDPYLNKSMDNHFEFSHINKKSEILDEPLLNKAHSSVVSNSQKRENKINQLHEHRNYGKNADFDEYHFKDLVNTKANVAKTITFHDKHRKKHEKKKKKIEIEKKIANSNGSPLSVDSKHATREIGKMTPYILLIALSFHGVFEGIAIGLQLEITQIANLLVAVALHKWAEALTLGMSFNKNESRKKLSIQMIIIFSATGPLGIIFGWALSQTSALISAIFMSISAGYFFVRTFLYISASEIVVEEFSISKNKWIKLIFFLFGVALIAGLWFLEEEN